MKKNLAVLFASAAVLAGCGGGGSSDLAVPPAPSSPAPAPVTSPPTAISSTVDNFIGYLLVLVGQTADTSEALDVSAVVPPVSDTTEPATLP